MKKEKYIYIVLSTHGPQNTRLQNLPKGVYWTLDTLSGAYLSQLLELQCMQGVGHQLHAQTRIKTTP